VAERRDKLLAQQPVAAGDEDAHGAKIGSGSTPGPYSGAEANGARCGVVR
jgi:hypothetical protein